MMAGGPIVFVDTLAALDRAREQFEGAWLITDNPLLAHDPRAQGALDDISTNLDALEGTELGHQAIDMLMALDDRLIALDIAACVGSRPGPLNITLAMRSLLTTMMHRGTMITRALRGHGAGDLHIFAVDRPQYRADHPWSFDWFSDPYRALAQHGFFGIRSVTATSVPTPLPDDINDTTTADTIMRAAIVPLPQLAYEIARRVLPGFLARKRSIRVGKLNEALRETLPWLALRGHRLERIGLPGYASGTGASSDQVDRDLSAAVHEIVTDRLTTSKAFGSCEAAAIGGVVLDRLTTGLGELAATTRGLADALDSAFGKSNGRAMLMTSGFYGPIGRQLIALCREKDIALADFEHGATTGIARTSQRRLRFSEATTSDLLLVSSQRAADAFGLAANEEKPLIHVIGLADQTRRVFRRALQRRRARRHLGLAKSEPAIIHVSTLLYGGTLRPGDDAPVERYVFETEKTLLTEVYAGLDKTLLYKSYPAQRYPHHARYDELFALAHNIRMIDDADFRYTRAAADVLVTTANSSTIGWCVGADVPLVHLSSRHINALVDEELRAKFAQAFLTVDLDEANWPQTLRSILDRDLDMIHAEWAEKRAARARLLRDDIRGPAGSVGRRAARVIREYLA